jgi:hypothetical protein
MAHYECLERLSFRQRTGRAVRPRGTESNASRELAWTHESSEYRERKNIGMGVALCSQSAAHKMMPVRLLQVMALIVGGPNETRKAPTLAQAGIASVKRWSQPRRLKLQLL